MALTALDQQQLQRALDAAQAAVGLSEPNPRVGCVLGHADGRLLGIGHTQQAGGPHAEVMALRDAQTAGHDLRGCTAWVTLEPCAHHGRTPPCCDALAAAGVARVVVAALDPFPQVAGRGVEHLRAAGVQVDIVDSDAGIALAARELNIGFFSRFERGRPWVRLKTAASLDGRTALDNGASQWITGGAARADGHAWRKRAGAVLTGVGTVLADDPLLDVRLVPTTEQPLRIVLDSTLRMPLTARLLTQGAAAALVVTALPAADARVTAWRTAGVDVLSLPGPDGRVAFAALLPLLADRGINELHVEAGAELSGAFVRAGLVDELLCYVAPVLMGPGKGMVHWPPLEQLAQMPRWRWLDAVMVGDDVRLRARLVGSPVGKLDTGT